MCSPEDWIFLPNKDFPFTVTMGLLPKKKEVVGADQLSKLICDSDSDEYRGPDSSSAGEGGWDGQPGVSIQPDWTVTRRTPTNEHLL
jgi:hypothetical protein